MSVSPRKGQSLPPLPTQHSYIERTLELLDNGCYKGSTLNIDGDIGDYRMRLFRNRDRKDYAKNITSVFTSSFTDSLLPKDPQDSEARELIAGIIRRPARSSITPQPEARVEGEGERSGKGNLSGVVEQQDYLLYKYLPEYQRKRWFEVKDRSVVSPEKSEKAESVVSNKKSSSMPKKPRQIGHIFAYLQHPLYLKTLK